MPPSSPHDLRLLITPHVRATDDGEITFLLRAPTGSRCTVVLTSARRISSRWLGHATRIVRFGTRRLSTPAGGEVPVTIRLSPDHLALLRRMQTIRVTARVNAVDGSGRATTARRSFSIHAPRRASRPSLARSPASRTAGMPVER